MRDTERVPLDALAEIAQLKRDLADLRGTTLKRIHNLSVPSDMVRFTSDGSFVKANYPGLKAIRIRLVGGGGGGGGCPTTSSTEAVGGGGGGGGGYAETFVKFSDLDASEEIVVGPGGAGGAAGQNNGVVGGQTRFGEVTGGEIAKALGGQPGFGGLSSSNLPKYGASGGGGGSATDGDIQIRGNSGEMAVLFETQVSITSLGGSSQLSPSSGRHSFTFSGAQGALGEVYGGGGGGGQNADDQGEGRAGGNGAGGIVIVELIF